MSKADSPQARDNATQEMRRIKEELAREFDFDIRRIVEDARAKQKTSGHKIIPAPARHREESSSRNQ